MTLSEVIRQKRLDRLRVAAHVGARDVRIFGSLARGEARPDSDVDLLVTLEPGVARLLGLLP
jgi:uncharacterized protein